jgi:serine/threonine-protein kinase RsbW
LAKEYKKIYPSNPDLLPEIEEYIFNTLSEVEFTEDMKNNIELAVAEASANSILHGNKCDINKNVIIKISINEEKITISFQDEGTGFNPDEVPDPTKPENILRGSGRGVHIMRSLVDDIKYIFNKNSTELILTFNR